VKHGSNKRQQAAPTSVRAYKDNTVTLARQVNNNIYKETVCMADNTQTSTVLIDAARLVKLTSCAACSGTDTTCPHPCKWWHIFHTLNVQLIPCSFLNCPLLVEFSSVVHY